MQIGAQGRNQPVRVRHRHEDFQSGFFYNLIKSVTYALPVTVCASKRQLLSVIKAQNWHTNLSESSGDNILISAPY